MCRSMATLFALPQANGLHNPLLSQDFSTEHPVLPLKRLEVFLRDPLLGLLCVSAFCPLPQHRKDGVVHRGCGLLAYDVPVIVGPSPNFGVELGNEVSCRRLLMVLHYFSDALKKRLHAFSRGCDQQFSVVCTEVLSEKVEAVLDRRDEGLLY